MGPPSGGLGVGPPSGGLGVGPHSGGLGVGPPSGGLGVRPPSGGLDIFKLAVLLYSGYNIVIKLQPTTMLPANQI